MNKNEIVTFSTISLLIFYDFVAKNMTVYRVFYFNVFAVKKLVFGFNIAANLLYLAAKMSMSILGISNKIIIFSGEIVIKLVVRF